MHLKQTNLMQGRDFWVSFWQRALLCVILLNKEAPDPDLTQSKPIPSRGKYGSSCNLSQVSMPVMVLEDS